jgi:Na+-transporting NADH:ubiquinone oxidoreductase subunit NqrC
MLKVYALIVVLGLVGGVGYGGYYYYKDTQQRIKTLTENNAKLEVAKQLQDDTIQTLVEDAEDFRVLNKKLATDLQEAEEYRNNLIDKLRKHDLTRLSQKKPSLVENKINNGTKKLFERLESLTALPPDPAAVK